MSDEQEALKHAEAWLDRWAVHVGNCRGKNNACTCGLTAIRHEAAAALSTAGREGVGEADVTALALRCGFVAGDANPLLRTPSHTFIATVFELRRFAAALATRPPVADDAVERFNVPRKLPQAVREAMTEVDIADGRNGYTALNWEEADKVWEAALAALSGTGE